MLINNLSILIKKQKLSYYIKKQEPILRPQETHKDINKLKVKGCTNVYHTNPPLPTPAKKEAGISI